MYKNKNICSKGWIPIFGLFILIALAAGSFGCDSVLPDEFKDKTFNPDAVDAKAGSILGKDTTGFWLDKPHTIFNVDTTRTLISMVDAATAALLRQDSITEDQVVKLKFNEILDSLAGNSTVSYNLGFDALRLVGIDAASETGYAILNVPAGKGGDKYIYTSLIYTADNLNYYAGIQLIRKDGTKAAFSIDMPAEVASSGTQSISVPGGTRLVPTIRTRYSLHVDEGVYLVRFSKSSVQNFGGFVKILILSK